MVVYYSLSGSQSNPRQDLIYQIESSIRSLRAYNTTIPVVVFVYGDILDPVHRALRHCNAHICYRGSYEARLAALAPRAWPVLSQYPLLHKFLNFADIAALRPSQVLFVDCDTLFFDDVEMLFSRYNQADCYAREEPTCARSHYGYDRSYVDEQLLAEVARREGVRFIPPFNLGVVLFNNGIWNHIAQIEQLLTDYAWRFMVHLALNPPDAAAARYGEGQDIAYLRRNLGAFVTESDLQRALVYPSSNRWILDQAALWLALGRLPDFSYADFSRRDVLQNGEILSRSPAECDWVLCHYYSQNMDRLRAWLEHHQAAAQRA